MLCGGGGGGEGGSTTYIHTTNALIVAGNLQLLLKSCSMGVAQERSVN